MWCCSRSHFEIIMEQEMLSMISSYPRMDINEESLDSNCRIHLPNSCKQSRRIERFKGVVPQQNGHWGAQIYANHQRVWLGTFRSEIDAAMAYDSASIKLRNGDHNSYRNFPFTTVTILEPRFQSHFSTDEVLSMIRDGSYPSKFAHFLKSQQGETHVGLKQKSLHDHGEFSCTLLFEKELTPSDVGKLNRLVIPKRYAVKHFPCVPSPSDHEHLDGEKVDQVQLEFYDREMSLWKFRYCYWKSSQSFVFTRGWNRFVNEKGLRANDTISFYMYQNHHCGQSFLAIEVATKDDSRNASSEAAKDDHTKGFKLFGVQID